jgi:hypothetical protein
MMQLPMIATVSHGGPYDDESFQAGYFAAMLHVVLADPISSRPFIVPAFTASVPQLDLIAMAYGWKTKVLSSQDEMSCVLLTRESVLSCDNTEG